MPQVTRGEAGTREAGAAAPVAIRPATAENTARASSAGMASAPLQREREVPGVCEAGAERSAGRWWGAIMSPDRKSTRLNSSHVAISYAVFCLKKKTLRRRAYHIVYY